jgi:hypothetical protein
LEATVMPQPKELPRRKCRGKALPALSAAGLSLALVSAASAAVNGMSEDLTARTARVSQQITLRDEEIGDVSLATFHVFDKESTRRPSARLAQSGGCGGCGCGCGSSFYYNPPVSSGPAYPPSLVHPTKKYGHSTKHPKRQ